MDMYKTGDTLLAEGNNGKHSRMPLNRPSVCLRRRPLSFVFRLLPFIFCLLPILFPSCTPQRPSGILSESKMEDVLVDYQLALAMADSKTGDVLENRYLFTQAALKKNNVTEAALDTSLVYWCQHSEKMAKICERVSDRISYMAESQGVDHQEKSRYSYLANEGDTANVWNLRNSVVLIPNLVDNVYSFTIDADTTFMPGDYFMWAFTTQFLASDQQKEAFALISILYENDSIMGVSQRISSNRDMEIRLTCPQGYEDTPIRSIHGTVYLPTREAGFGILALSDFVLVRYHDLTRKRTEEEEDADVHADSLQVEDESDTLRVRSNPYDIRGDKAEQRTIDIVRDKPIRTRQQRRR